MKNKLTTSVLKFAAVVALGIAGLYPTGYLVSHNRATFDIMATGKAPSCEHARKMSSIYGKADFATKILGGYGAKAFHDAYLEKNCKE